MISNIYLIIFAKKVIFYSHSGNNEISQCGFTFFFIIFYRGIRLL